MRRYRSFGRLLLVVLVGLVGLAAAGAFGWRELSRPLPLPSSPYDFDVRSGATLASVARELTAAGVLPRPAWLTVYARLTGVDRTIKAGSYEIASGVTLRHLLAKLTQGDVTQSSITIVEGATFAQMKEVLRANAGIRDTLLDLPDAELLARLGIAGEHAEGLFFPDTYFFARNATDASVLKRAARMLDARLAAGWTARAADLPLATPYDALILASIVEKETGRAADRPLVASVFINRLRLGMPLQTDPTVIYGMRDAFDGNLRKRDLAVDTPYNTYTRSGLPPTPIALVSQASLDAVLNPPPTHYLYFVARGDGTSAFSATLGEHNQAVARYQRGGRS
ncbi:MAG TPA: endolytic transglycosylase MltG [Casimicrobiaceae bacterium]